MISIDLPFPPSTNNAYATFQGRRILSTKGREYHVRVAERVILAGSPRIEGRLAVWLHIHPPDRRARDIANFEKLCIDGLAKAGVFDNDNQIDDLRLSRLDIVPGGKIRVHIEPWKIED